MNERMYTLHWIVGLRYMWILAERADWPKEKLLVSHPILTYTHLYRILAFTGENPRKIPSK